MSFYFYFIDGTACILQKLSNYVLCRPVKRLECCVNDYQKYA